MGKVASAAPRPARETLIELVGLAYVGVSLVAILLWWVGGANLVGFGDEVVAAGEAVLAQLGWVIGVYVPTLLAFYVLVIGEQFNGLANAGKLRRILGGVSEATFASLIPSVLLVAVYCVVVANLGPLFVIVPAIALLLFLTVQLGAFVVFDADVQLVEAEKSHIQSRTRLRALRLRSRRPIVLVFAVNVALVCAVGCLAFVIVGAPSALTQPIVYAYAFVGALTACLLAAFAAVLFAERTVASRIAGVGVLGVVAITVSSIARTLEAPVLAPMVVAVVTMAAVSTLSAVAPLRHARRFLVDWTLAGAFTAVVARRTVREYQRSGAEIRRLNSLLVSSQGSRLGTRVRAAWAALRAE